MTYVAADKYLRDEGRLGFVITRTVFLSQLGGWHFRSFTLPSRVPLAVEVVHDFSQVKPFRGQAANETSTLVLLRGQETEFPVPWVNYRVKPGCSLSEDLSLQDAMDCMETEDWPAQPINPSYDQSSWLYGDANATDVLRRTMAPSYYASEAREGINTRGANGVYFVEAHETGGRLVVKNRRDAGRDATIPVVEKGIESDYVFPLLRGSDVQRWTADPDLCVVLPHEEENPTSPVSFNRLPPGTQEFLHAFKDKLRSRKTFRNFDPSGPDWHGLYSVLRATFAPFKVVWREMAKGSKAAVVSQAILPTGERKLVIPDHKLFIIPCYTGQEAHFVCGIFNSSISSYLIRSYAISTGISTHVLDRLPIPRFDQTKPEHQEIASVAGQCAEAAERGNDVTDLEMDVNDCAAALFGLSEEELRAVQAALADLG
jgi:hypothetical protein